MNTVDIINRLNNNQGVIGTASLLIDGVKTASSLLRHELKTRSNQQQHSNNNQPVGIYIEDCKDVSLINNTTYGYARGIEVHRSESITAEGNKTLH